MTDTKLTSPALILRERPNYTDEELIKKGRDPVKWKADSTRSNSVYMDVLYASNQIGYLVRVNETGHFSFSDAPFLMPAMLTRFLGTYLNPYRNLELITNLMYTFIKSSGNSKKMNDFKNQFKRDSELAIVKVH